MEAPASAGPGEVKSVAPATFVASESELDALLPRLAAASRFALDIESNGLFKYRATLCTIQIAIPDVDGRAEVIVIDPLKTPLGKLGPLVGPGGPRKIVHDVAFDARILSEAKLPLGNVLDTSIAARMLGRTATGLASLLGAELRITVDKKLQHHDWTERPITPEQLRYLGDDVQHLALLADKLWSEVEARGIGDAVEEETRYRIAQAIAATSAGDPRPPYLRMKGIDRASAQDLPLLRHLAQLREDKARELDVPPYKVMGPDILFAIARARPRTMAELGNVKGALQGHRARALAQGILEAVEQGLRDGEIPAADKALLERPRLPPAVVKARRAREGRLTSWRKIEAKNRGVDEQVVLPGHCLQDLANLEPASPLSALERIPGLGAFRIARDGPTLLALLTPPARPTDDVRTDLSALDRERATIDEPPSPDDDHVLSSSPKSIPPNPTAIAQRGKPGTP